MARETNLKISKSLKVLITTSTFSTNIENNYFEKYNFQILKNPYNKRLTDVQITNLLDDSVIGIIAGLETLNEEVLSNAPNLRVISRCGIGLENIDLNYTKKNNIRVFNTPDAPSKAVAELALAHILSSIRRLLISNYEIKKNVWKPLMGTLLYKKKVGILGFGRIGKNLANLLTPFQCEIMFFDPYVESQNDLFRKEELDELLKKSDIISIHLPLNSETKNLINKSNLLLLKNNATIINTARGGVINENDLFDFLNQNSLAYAALDCFEEEPYNGKLLNLQNIQLSAHMGSYAIESREMMEKEAIQNLIKGLI